MLALSFTSHACCTSRHFLCFKTWQIKNLSLIVYKAECKNVLIPVPVVFCYCSKKREVVPDLAPMLWHSFGTIAALMQEIVNIYSAINPPVLTVSLDSLSVSLSLSRSLSISLYLPPESLCLSLSLPLCLSLLVSLCLSVSITVSLSPSPPPPHLFLSFSLSSPSLSLILPNLAVAWSVDWR